MACQLALAPMTLSDLQGHAPVACLLDVIFRTAAQNLMNLFNWHSAPHGPSVIADLDKYVRLRGRPDTC